MAEKMLFTGMMLDHEELVRLALITEASEVDGSWGPASLAEQVVSEIDDFVLKRKEGTVCSGRSVRVHSKRHEMSSEEEGSEGAMEAFVGLPAMVTPIAPEPSMIVRAVKGTGKGKSTQRSSCTPVRPIQVEHEAVEPVEMEEGGEKQARMLPETKADKTVAPAPIQFINRLKVAGVGFLVMEGSVEIEGRLLPVDRSNTAHYRNLILATVACGLKCPVKACDHVFSPGTQVSALNVKRDSEGHLLEWKEGSRVNVAAICSHWEETHFEEGIRAALKVACPFVDSVTGVACTSRMTPAVHDLSRHMINLHGKEKCEELRRYCAVKVKDVGDRTVRRPVITVIPAPEVAATFARGFCIRSGVMKNLLIPIPVAPAAPRRESSQGNHHSSRDKARAKDHGSTAKAEALGSERGHLLGELASRDRKRPRDQSAAGSSHRSESSEPRAPDSDTYEKVHRSSASEKRAKQKEKKRARRDGDVVVLAADQNPRLGALQVTLDSVSSRTGKKTGHKTASKSHRRVTAVIEHQQRPSAEDVAAGLQAQARAHQLSVYNDIKAAGLRELDALKAAIHRSHRLLSVAELEETPSPVLALQELVRCSRDFMGGWSAYHLRCLSEMERVQVPVDDSRQDQYVDTAARVIVDAGVLAAEEVSAARRRPTVEEPKQALPTPILPTMQPVVIPTPDRVPVLRLTPCEPRNAPVVYAVGSSGLSSALNETFPALPTRQSSNQFPGCMTVLHKKVPVFASRVADAQSTPGLHVGLQGVANTTSTTTPTPTQTVKRGSKAEGPQCSSVAEGVASSPVLTPSAGPSSSDQGSTPWEPLDFGLGYPRVLYHPDRRLAGFGPSETPAEMAQHASSVVLPTVGLSALVGSVQELLDLLRSAQQVGQLGEAGVGFMEALSNLHRPGH